MSDITLVEGDCLDALRGLPERCADLVFADPPYNLQLKGELDRPEGGQVAAVNDAWDRFDSFEAYDGFSHAWLSECQRILKPGGSLWVMGTYHNIFRLGALLQDLGFWVVNDVIWRKSNPMPNFRGTRLQNAHETLIWAVPSKTAKPRFHYHAGKEANDGTQMRSDWVLPLCTGAERVKGPDGKKLHPTQKPEALLHRVLMLCSQPGDLVVDPFFGVGTTPAVAKRLGRRFWGCERESAYVRAARERIAAITPDPKAALEVSEGGRGAPRVPFGHLVERRMVKPGEVLYSPDGRRTARVRIDGSVACGDEAGSIHQMGAKALAAAACNGWTFWHIKKSGKLTPLDALRAQVRAEWAKAGLVARE